MSDVRFEEDYDDEDYAWEDPDWYDDEDEDYLDEWMREDDATIRLTWRDRLHVRWSALIRRFNPNRLRKCPQCGKRGHTEYRDGVCLGCWIPF